MSESSDWFGCPTDRYETLICVEGERAFTRTEAILRVLRQLPAPRWCLGTLAVVPRAVRHWLYGCIALNRYRLLGRYEECMMRAPELMQRFIDHD